MESYSHETRQHWDTAGVSVESKVFAGTNEVLSEANESCKARARRIFHRPHHVRTSECPSNCLLCTQKRVEQRHSLH
jgi:hypothetical protein